MTGGWPRCVCPSARLGRQGPAASLPETGVCVRGPAAAAARGRCFNHNYRRFGRIDDACSRSSAAAGAPAAGACSCWSNRARMLLGASQTSGPASVDQSQPWTTPSMQQRRGHMGSAHCPHGLSEPRPGWPLRAQGPTICWARHAIQPPPPPPPEFQHSSAHGCSRATFTSHSKRRHSRVPGRKSGAAAPQGDGAHAGAVMVQGGGVRL